MADEYHHSSRLTANKQATVNWMVQIPQGQLDMEKQNIVTFPGPCSALLH